MIRFVGHLHVDVAPQVAFDRLADMDQLHVWNPNVSMSRRTEGLKLEPGSRYESVIVRGPIRLTAHSTLVEVELGRRVKYEGSIAAFWSVDQLTFQPHHSGTRVTFFNETRLPCWLRPLGPLMNAAFQPQARQAVIGAHRQLNRPV